MVIHDRIRLTGLLRKSPATGAFLLLSRFPRCPVSGRVSHSGSYGIRRRSSRSRQSPCSRRSPRLPFPCCAPRSRASRCKAGSARSARLRPGSRCRRWCGRARRSHLLRRRSRRRSPRCRHRSSRRLPEAYIDSPTAALPVKPMWRQGALAHVDKLTPNPGPGIWISNSTAAATGLRPGDRSASWAVGSPFPSQASIAPWMPTSGTRTGRTSSARSAPGIPTRRRRLPSC